MEVILEKDLREDHWLHGVDPKSPKRQVFLVSAPAKMLDSQQAVVMRVRRIAKRRRLDSANESSE